MFRQNVKTVYPFGVNVIRDLSNLSLGRLAVLMVTLALAGAGCKREQVSSYQVPKEDHSVKPFSMPGMGPGMAGGATAEENAPPQLKWTTPKGWQEKPAQMGAGAFHIEGEDGKFADVKVIPLRAGPEIEPRSVNMWRNELGLAELRVDQVKGEEIDVGGTHGHLYDLTSEALKFAGKYKSRTTAAILEQEGTLWFVKMAGEESVVSGQEQNFRDFLKSLRFEAGMPAGDPQIANAASGGDGATASSPAGWKIPAGWKQLPPRQMVMVAYQASKGGATAEITVSSFPDDAGGLLANVNRWRGQMALTPIGDADLATQAKAVVLSDGATASAVDVTGTNAKTGKPGRLYGLIVPRGGTTWFYKLLGDSDVVGTESTNLVEFAGTAH